MNALLLFCSQFVLVTLLVVQSVNNNHGRATLAMVTSVGIGLMQVAAYRLMPDAGPLEILGFIAGAPLGNIAAQWLKRHDIAKIRELHD